MQSFSTIRRFVPVLAVVALFLVASCTTNKKYGCPNKLQTSVIVIK